MGKTALIISAIYVLVSCLFCFMIATANADPIYTKKTLYFSWDAVTENADGSPCTDLAGYALYRSRDMDDLIVLTGADQAYATVDKETIKCTCLCPEEGLWFWMVRAYDLSGNYSAISNVLTCIVDDTSPSAVLNFSMAPGGDITKNGVTDGEDLKILAEDFGK